MERQNAAFLEFCNATHRLEDLPEFEQIHRLKKELRRALVRAADAQGKELALKKLYEQLQGERDSGAWRANVALQFRGKLADQANELARTRARLDVAEATNRKLLGHCHTFAIVLEEDIVAVQELDRILGQRRAS